jgi:hypothetical protein
MAMTILVGGRVGSRVAGAVVGVDEQAEITGSTKINVSASMTVLFIVSPL